MAAAIGRRNMKYHSILCLLLVVMIVPRVFADSCVGASYYAATNQHYKVEGRANRESNTWSYILTDVKTGEKRTGPLPGIKWHAHLYFFISQDGKRFAVLDASAGHHLANRFMIFNSKGDCIASLGIHDILNTNEHTKIVRSVSHIRWLKYDRDTKSYGSYLPECNAVRLKTITGRDVIISLADGKLIKNKE
jgi:hypothetical protein